MGQSDQAMFMSVGGLSDPCIVSQVFFDMDGAPTDYDLTIDYKDTVVFGNSLEITVQRCSDLWYWDNTGASWVSAYNSVQVPFSSTRTRLAVMNNILNAAPDGLLVSISKVPVVPAPHSVWVYAVLLTK
jgi:hypothetical protein